MLPTPDSVVRIQADSTNSMFSLLHQWLKHNISYNTKLLESTYLNSAGPVIVRRKILLAQSNLSLPRGRNLVLSHRGSKASEATALRDNSTVGYPNLCAISNLFDIVSKCVKSSIRYLSTPPKLRFELMAFMAILIS